MSLALLKNLLFAAERKRQFPTPDLVLTNNMASASRMTALIFIFIFICIAHPPQPDNPVFEKILPKRKLTLFLSNPASQKQSQTSPQPHQAVKPLAPKTAKYHGYHPNPAPA